MSQRNKETPFTYNNPNILPYDGSLETPQLSSLHQDICTSQLNDFYTPVRCVYLDLRYLKDYVLGALFALANTEEKKHILSRIHAYNQRMSDADILSFFPEVSVTSDQLNDFLNDKENADALILRAPTTDFYENLYTFCSMVTQHNQRIKAEIKTKFCINFYPFDPSPLVKDFFAKLIQDVSPRFSLTVMKHALHTLPKDVTLPGRVPFFQVMCIYDFDMFTSEQSTVCREFLEYLLFVKTIVYAPRRVSPEIEIPDDPLMCADMFTATENLMRICSQFTYLDPLLPSE